MPRRIRHGTALKKKGKFETEHKREEPGFSEESGSGAYSELSDSYRA
jgi:hypothetical protein